MEQTLILLKPDAVQRRLIGRLIERFEARGLSIVGLKMLAVSRELAAKHYECHKGKPFYKPLIEFITSGPVVAMVIEGVNAVAVTRKMLGATFGFNAEPGTIRGDFGVSRSFNLVHGSDSVEAANAEISLYFTPGEIVSRDPVDLQWIYRCSEGGSLE